MMPGIPQPDSIPLPAPAWFLEALLVATFLLHVLPMNFVLGGSILGAIARLRARDGRHPHHAALASWIGRALPVAVAAAVTTGVAALLFLQALHGRLFFTSSILMAWPWFAVVPLLIAAYYATYGLAGASVTRPAPLWMALLVPAALATVAFLYSNNMSLMLRPGSFVEMYRAGGGGLQLNVTDPVMLPRFLHATTGAIAVAGLVCALVGARAWQRQQAYSRWVIDWGARWFIGATAVNVVFGTWWLVALPQQIALGTMGQVLGLTLSLAGGIVLALAAFALVMVSRKSEAPASVLAGAGGALVGALALMILTRDQIRNAVLSGAGYVQADWTSTQTGPLVVFLLLAVAAVAAVAWMVVALVRAKRTQERPEQSV